MPTITMIAKSKPGIQRDGTIFDGDAYSDGQHCRFYRGNPRKIGGYKLISQGTQEIARNVFSYQQQNNNLDLYLGRASSLNVVTVTESGLPESTIDRTPSGFTASTNNLWQFDLITNIAMGVPTTYTIANGAANLDDINNQTETPIYYGNVNNTTPLTQLATEVTAGGIVATSPYLFNYGTDGVVRWCDSQDITNWSTGDSGQEAITSTKIVRGMRTRGGGVQSVLFWSLDSLVRATFAGTGITPIFNFDTIDDDISILSSNCVVKYKNMFFWVGIDQFYMYNGVVQPLPNPMNGEFFFDNLNYDQRQKVWGWVNPRYKEIWWHWPSVYSPNGECDTATVYNIEGNFWFTTLIDRASGISAKTFQYPILSGSTTNTDEDNSYGIWLHEFGYDKVINNTVIAIPSYFETNIITLSASNPNLDRQFRTRRIEPDFKSLPGTNSNMSVVINNRGFANGPVTSSIPYNFDSSTEKIDTNSMGRQVSFKFESNITGGFYEAGKIIVDFEVGDVRPNGAVT